MFRKFLILCLTLLVTPVFAMEITVSAPPGGNAGKTANAMIDALRENKISGEVKYNANCAVVKNNIENNQASMIYLNTAWGLLDPVCSIKIDGVKVKMIDQLYYYTLGLCYRKDRTNLGWNDFVSDRKKNIAVSIVAEAPTKKILSSMKATATTNLVVVGNSGRTHEVVLGNEFDYAVVDADFVAKNSDKVDCLFIGTDKEQNLNGSKYPSLQEVLKSRYNTTTDASLQDVWAIIAVNLKPEEELELKLELQIIDDNKSWQDFIHQFGRDKTDMNENRFNKITNSLRE